MQSPNPDGRTVKTIPARNPSSDSPQSDRTSVRYIGEMKTGDRCVLRYGFWPSRREKVSGSVVLLSGRTEFMEKYEETIGDLLERGFGVYSFDWRGQGLSTRMLPGRRCRYRGYIDGYDVYFQDLHQFMEEIVLPGAYKPLICMGHSMGGHIALHYLRDHPGCFDQAVLLSPMVDIMAPPVPIPFIRFLTRWAIRRGCGHLYAFGEKDYCSRNRTTFRRNVVTTDCRRYLAETEAVSLNPDLGLGGVTYGWLQASFDAIDRLHSDGFAETIRTPVLMVTAGDDRVVPVAAQQAYAAALPDCQFKLIPNAYHEILMEKDVIRNRFWSFFDAFVQKNT